MFSTGEKSIPVQKSIDAKNFLELPVYHSTIELLQLKLTYDHSWIGLDLVAHYGIVYICTSFPILLIQIRSLYSNKTFA